MTSEFAAAKINLTLHVTGQRADGYHLLDSLVTFAAVGDELRGQPAEALSLEVLGSEAAGLPADDDNLVLRAARMMAAPAALRLEKRLPLASGIGGGSADAAATLRLLARMSGAALPEAAAVLALGADVPVCLQGETCRMAGVGEQITPVPGLPQAWVVLANPRVEVPTPAVFKALAEKNNPPMPAQIGPFGDLSDFVDWLAAQRNDLEDPAMEIAPVIGEVLDALEDLPGALMARMSGSGATCFALFASQVEAARGCYKLQDSYADWWVAYGALGDAAAVAPQA